MGLFNSFLIVSLIVILIFFGICFSFMFIFVVVDLINSNDWMNFFGNCNLLIGKLLMVCWVCVVYKVFFVMFRLFILLCLICVFVIGEVLIKKVMWVN